MLEYLSDKKVMDEMKIEVVCPYDKAPKFEAHDHLEWVKCLESSYLKPDVSKLDCLNYESVPKPFTQQEQLQVN